MKLFQKWREEGLPVGTRYECYIITHAFGSYRYLPDGHVIIDLVDPYPFTDGIKALVEVQR